MDVRGCGIRGCGSGGAAMMMLIYIKNECNKKGKKSCVLLLLCFADLLPNRTLTLLLRVVGHDRGRDLLDAPPAYPSAALKQETYPTHKVTQTSFAMHSRRNFHAHYVAKDYIHTTYRRILAEKRRAPFEFFESAVERASPARRTTEQ